MDSNFLGYHLLDNFFNMANIMDILSCIKSLFYRLRIFILLLLSLTLTCSCTRTVYTPVETVRYHTDTLRLIQQRTDSIMLRDSVSLIVHNDTVYYTKFRDRTRFIERIDTVYKHLIDTARISIPNPVEKPLSWWQRTKMTCGSVAICLFAGVLIYVVVWIIRRFRR